MKKVLLILAVLVLAGSVSAGWFTKKEMKSEPEVKTGQVWEHKTSGDKREVFDVGGKYIIYGYTNRSDENYPSVKTKERFLEYFKLFEDVEEECVWVLHDGTPIDEIGVTTENFISESTRVATEPKKPYLHKNPNNDHWICSKHGDISPEPVPEGDVLIDFSTVTIHIEGEATTYCQKCYWDVQAKLIEAHITGVKENSK